MIKILYAVCFISVIAALTQLTACNARSYESPSAEVIAVRYEPTPAPAPPIADFGGTLTLTMRNPLTLNPLLNVCETVDRVLSLIFERLFIEGDGRKPIPNPALVLDYTPSDDGGSLTLTLRDDVLWSDGTRFTANDVAFSIDFLRNSAPAGAIYRRNVANISSVTPVDAQTVRINLNQPNSFMGYNLMIPIVSRDYYRNISAAHARQMNPVGNGPFRLYSFTLGRGLVLAASETSARGRPYIDFVDVRFLDTDEQSINALYNGISDAAILHDLSGFAGRVNLRTASFVSGHFDFVGFNFDGVMSDRNLRAAVAHSIPFHLLVDVVYAGEAVLSPTPVSPGSWLHDEYITHAEYDLETAAEFLAEALYSSEEEYWLRILYNTESPERARIAHMLADNLYLLGMPVVLLSEEWDEYIGILQNGGFDIFLGGYNLSVNPDMRFMLYSAGAGQTNPQRYRSPALDALLREAASARGSQEKIAAYHYLQQYIVSEMPVVGIAFRTAALVVNTRVMGRLCANGIFQNIEEWFLNVR